MKRRTGAPDPTPDTPMHQVGRIAYRQEGRMWNAYWALPDTMKDALFLGSIPLTAAKTSDALHAGFLRLMRDTVSHLLELQTGQKPVWPDEPQPAPEHEKVRDA